MFGRRITLFRIFGFAIRMDASWIVIAILVTWSLAAAVFPNIYPGLPISSYWWMGLVGAVAFFGCIVIHELCHSLVANHYKLPMKGITLFIFGGVAEMGSEPQSPKVEFLMAIAGPIASVILGLICEGIRVLAAPSWPVEVVGVLAYLAWINIILAVFNMIPAFPLDGGRVLRAALWHFKGDLVRATSIASRIGSGFGVLLMLYGVWQLFAGAFIGAIWYFLIGMFLRNASRMSYQHLLLRTELAGEPVSRFMRPHPITIPRDLSVRQFVQDYMYRYDFKVYPVINDEGDLVGCVTMQDVRGLSPEEWDRRTVAELAKPCSAENTVTPETDAVQALAQLQHTGGTNLFVTERNHLLAVVSPRDIINFLAAKLRLEGRSHVLPHAPGT
jgi:Zn-dependent protease/CBS domain-containing protein